LLGELVDSVGVGLVLPSQAALVRSLISWGEVKARPTELDDEDNADLPAAA